MQRGLKQKKTTAFVYWPGGILPAICAEFLGAGRSVDRSDLKECQIGYRVERSSGVIIHLAEERSRQAANPQVA